jgi:hypothetical protein
MEWDELPMKEKLWWLNYATLRSQKEEKEINKSKRGV